MNGERVTLLFGKWKKPMVSKVATITTCIQWLRNVLKTTIYISAPCQHYYSFLMICKFVTINHAVLLLHDWVCVIWKEIRHGAHHVINYADKNFEDKKTSEQKCRKQNLYNELEIIVSWYTEIVFNTMTRLKFCRDKRGYKTCL